MPSSELKFIKRYSEFCPREEIKLIPPKTRGIYALLKHNTKLDKYDVVYVGMAGGTTAGIRRRIISHSKSRDKGRIWTHFSVFEAWDNISEDEIRELEGLFRHIYRKDTRANQLNRQRSFKKLKEVKLKNLSKWTNRNE